MFGSQVRKLRIVEILILRPNWIFLFDEFSSLILRVLLNIQLNKIFMRLPCNSMHGIMLFLLSMFPCIESFNSMEFHAWKRYCCMEPYESMHGIACGVESGCHNGHHKIEPPDVI